MKKIEELKEEGFRMVENGACEGLTDRLDSHLTSITSELRIYSSTELDGEYLGNYAIFAKSSQIHTNVVDALKEEGFDVVAVGGLNEIIRASKIYFRPGIKELRIYCGSGLDSITSGFEPRLGKLEYVMAVRS